MHQTVFLHQRILIPLREFYSHHFIQWLYDTEEPESVELRPNLGFHGAAYSPIERLISRAPARETEINRMLSASTLVRHGGERCAGY
jgi:hypothetical protein